MVKGLDRYPRNARASGALLALSILQIIGFGYLALAVSGAGTEVPELKLLLLIAILNAATWWLMITSNRAWLHHARSIAYYRRAAPAVEK